MDLSDRVAAAFSICRPNIEGFEFPTILRSPESNTDKSSGIVRSIGKKGSAYIHFDNTIVEGQILHSCIGIDIRLFCAM